MNRISRERLFRIATQLLERSRKGDVVWSELEKDVYSVELAGSLMTIKFTSPRAEPDYCEFEIKEPTGRVLGEATDLEPGREGETIRELFLEAERQVYKWDDLLDDLDRELREEGKIGLPRRKPATSSTSRNKQEEDIPF